MMAKSEKKLPFPCKNSKFKHLENRRALSSYIFNLQRATWLLTSQRNGFLQNWQLFERQKTVEKSFMLFFGVLSSMLFCPVYYPVQFITCVPFSASRLYMWYRGSFQQVILKQKKVTKYITQSQGKICSKDVFGLGRWHFDFPENIVTVEHSQRQKASSIASLFAVMSKAQIF